MTEIYIISGFLGAGKTSLIKTMVRSAFLNRKIVVIENDFGEAGIDAGILKEYNLEVTSLNEGCICCSLTGDFERALDRVMKDFKPDTIFVEPSGVGKLSDIIKICLKQEMGGSLYLKKSITVVDIRTFDKYKKNYGEFFEDQVAYGDLILLSHQEECPTRIKAVEDKIREINAQARIETGFWDSVPASVFRSGMRSGPVFKLELEMAVGLKPVRIRSSVRSGRDKKPGFFRRHFAGEIFSSVTLEWTEPLTDEALRKKVLRVVKYADGEILRGKGIVAESSGSGIRFHFIPGSLDIEPAGVSGNQVCFIGVGLDKQQIRTLFSEEGKDEDTCMGHNRSVGRGKNDAHKPHNRKGTGGTGYSGGPV